MATAACAGNRVHAGRTRRNNECAGGLAGRPGIGRGAGSGKCCRLPRANGRTVHGDGWVWCDAHRYGGSQRIGAARCVGSGDRVGCVYRRTHWLRSTVEAIRPGVGTGSANAESRCAARTHRSGRSSRAQHRKGIDRNSRSGRSRAGACRAGNRVNGG